MNLYDSTASALRWGALIAVAITVLGLMADAAGFKYGNDAVWIGALVLILSPLLGVFVSAIALIRERDMKWASIAAVLIAVTLLGTAAAWFF